MTAEEILRQIKPWQIFQYSRYDPDTEHLTRMLCVAIPDWTTRDRLALEYFEIVGDGTHEGDKLTRYFVNYIDDASDVVIRHDLRLKMIIEGGQIRFKIETVGPTISSSESSTAAASASFKRGDKVRYKYLVNGIEGFTGQIVQTDTLAFGRRILTVDADDEETFSKTKVKIAPEEDWIKLD